jgi:arylsulfatase A
MAKGPNVILIVADDMGYGDFGVFNDGPARTPHLDALVQQGLCLSQHYAGSPVCSPSRAALLTGRYPHRTGALTPMEVRGRDRIALDEVTIGDAYKHAGYATGLIGKWHNGAFDDRYHPNARGFDEFVGFRGGWMDYFNWWIERNGQRETADGRYLTDVFTAEAVDFVRRHRQQPFLLCVMYNAPHSPLQAPDEVVQPYVDAGMNPGVAITYAMNEIMDQGVGQIAETLEELGLTGQEEFAEAGGDELIVVPCLNSGKVWEMKCADMIRDHLGKQGWVSETEEVHKVPAIASTAMNIQSEKVLRVAEKVAVRVD